MYKQYLIFGRTKVFPNLFWAFASIAILCLLGCETFQHENIKVGQPKMVAIDIKEKYLDTDSVLQRLGDLHIKTQLDSLLLLTELLDKFDDNVALTYAQEANRIAIEQGQELSTGISQYYLAMFRERQSGYGEKFDVIVDANLCRRLFQKTQRRDWLAQINTFIGGIYYAKAKYDSAMVYLDQSLNILKTIDLPENQIMNMKGEIYLLLANIYSTSDTLKANQYYNQSLSLYNTTNNTNDLHRVKAAMGYYYLYDLKSLDRADQMFQASLKYAAKQEDHYVLESVYSGFATLKRMQYLQTKDAKYFHEAINFLQNQHKHQKKKSFYTYQIMGIIYHDKITYGYPPETTATVISAERSADLDSALVNYHKAITYAKEDGDINSIENISKAFLGLCNWRSVEVGESCDSLFGTAPITFINKNYKGLVDKTANNLISANQKIRKYERKEQEILHEQKVFRQRILYGVGLIFSALLFMIILQRSQQKRLISKMEALRAQINPHFISNSLNAIESLVNLGQKEAASKYLVHFSRLSRRILNNSRSANVTLYEELDTLEHFLALEQLRFRDKLHFDIDIQADINPKLIEVPAMILQPFVENAIWHGIKPKSEAGLVKVIIEKENKNLRCIIEDNGIGREKAKEIKNKSVLKHKSQGMQISKERLEAIGKVKGAHIEIIDLKDKNGKARGTRVVLRFPLKYKK